MTKHSLKNFVIFVAVLILIFFSISCVSAANNNTYVSINGSNSWDGSTPTHTNATNGPKQTIAGGLSVTNNGGNISIAAGTYHEYNLVISKNITISGASKTNTIIDGMGNNLIFYIKPGTIVTIKNLKMANGTASRNDYSRNGGGIYNEGTLTLDNCVFYNNRAQDADDATATSNSPAAGNGGAIYNKGTLTITNSEFSGNHAGQGGDSSATHKGSAGGSGGAIYNLGIIMNIQACTFRDNYAGRGGKSSAFHDGHSGGSGGAIYNVGTLNNILSCTFTDNYAGNGGKTQEGTGPFPGAGGDAGAIYNIGTVTINSSNFVGNYAGNGGDGSIYRDGAKGGHGGAFYNSGSFTIINSLISWNNAGNGGEGFGGANGGDAGHGGAIYNSRVFTISNCNISYNTAGIGGKNYGDAVLLRQDGDNGMGGGIYNEGNLTINNSTKIYDNSAENGGGIYNTGNTTITNTSFTDNIANFRCHFKSTATDPGYTLSLLIGGEGGAVWNNGNLTLMNNTFTRNSALYGGAVYYTGNRTYNITNCNFDNNNAIAVDDQGETLQVVSYSIDGGWKAFLSATIKSISKTVLIYKISPKQGIASIVGDIVNAVKMVDKNEDEVEAAGGAIYMIKSVNLSVNNSKFTNNIASLGGGICNLGNGTLIITNSQFTGNAAGVGGGVYSNNLGPLNVTNNIFNGNCAHGGGAISYTGSESSEWGNLTVKENIFRKNDASLGGAVYDNFQGNTHIYMNFNLIYGTDNYDIYDEVGKANVELNWWGLNTGPSTYNVYGDIDTSPWMVLTINSPNVDIGDNSTITFDMLHDSNGNYPNPAYGVLPDGIPISLIVSSGNITPSTITIINGIANTTYIANGNTGPVTMNVTLDNNDYYLISSTFIVNKILTNTFLNPVSNFAGQNVTLVAKVTDTHGRLVNEGNVIFNIGIAQIEPVSVVNGYAEYYLHIPEGTQPLLYTLNAIYNGTNNYTTSQATANFIVNQASIGSTGITVYPPVNGTQAQTVNLVARLIDAFNNLPLANKTVTFSLNGNNVGSAITDSNGVATRPYLILLAAGSYTILASFAADSPYSGSSNTGMLNVMPSPTGISNLTISRKVQSIVRLGDNFVIRIKIGNNGPDVAKDVVIKFTIPAAFNFVTASVDQGTWSYDENTGLFTWNLGDVAVGDPYLNLTLKATEQGIYLLNHLITTRSYDPNLENQITPLSITIKAQEDTNGNSVNAANKTIYMQNTGLPIAGLVLAILAVLGGFLATKRK